MCDGCNNCKCDKNGIKIVDISQVICELNNIQSTLYGLDLTDTDYPGIGIELSVRVKSCMDTLINIVGKTVVKPVTKEVITN